jgi:peptide/nickel transport system substrate-binding protein
MKDWKNSIGTGPFMLDEYVEASAFTYSKNPDYAGMDPLIPGNKLPYIDTLQWLIIPDRSTMIASLRTGKLDWVENIGWEERDSLKGSNPELQEGEYFQGGRPIGMYMMNASEPPFDDIRVRQAMALAIDQVAIKDDFYGGNAVLFSSPAAPYAEFLPWFLPLDEYPQVVQELYEYHPDKAEALFDEAGVTRGSDGVRIRAEIVTHTLGVEILSIAVAMWAKVGVEVELDVREKGVWSAMRGDRSWTSMLDSNFSTVAPYLIPQFRPGRAYNKIDDERINATYATCAANLVTNDPACQQALRDLYPYMMEQSYYVETPAAKLWVTWQPWIKGYGGETTVGTDETFNFPKYIWNDQSIGGN